MSTFAIGETTFMRHPEHFQAVRALTPAICERRAGAPLGEFLQSIPDGDRLAKRSPFRGDVDPAIGHSDHDICTPESEAFSVRQNAALVFNDEALSAWLAPVSRARLARFRASLAAPSFAARPDPAQGLRRAVDTGRRWAWLWPRARG